MSGFLEGKIAEAEKKIKDRLESTNLISNVEFYHGNDFSMSYEVFNNQKVRKIINQCCEKTLSEVLRRVPHIKNIDRKNMNTDPKDCFYKETVTLDPSVKAIEEHIYQILLILEHGIRKYLARNEHKKALAYYKKLRSRRCRRNY